MGVGVAVSTQHAEEGCALPARRNSKGSGEPVMVGVGGSTQHAEEGCALPARRNSKGSGGPVMRPQAILLADNVSEKTRSCKALVDQLCEPLAILLADNVSESVKVRPATLTQWRRLADPSEESQEEFTI